MSSNQNGPAAKNIFASLPAALQSHRGVRHKVTVEHVYVRAESRAASLVETGRAPLTKKSEKQPHAKEPGRPRVRRGPPSDKNRKNNPHAKEPARPRVRRGPPPHKNRKNNPMQSKLPMHLSPRCGARTRGRTTCQSPAMPNGRCRMHGGRSPGAPKGNRRAVKAGRYTAETKARRREIAALLRNMRALIRGHRLPADDRDGRSK